MIKHTEEFKHEAVRITSGDELKQRKGLIGLLILPILQCPTGASRLL